MDVTAFGEYLIDFTAAGRSEHDMMLFEQNPGGAPANVAVCIARLGGVTSFIGKIGKDMFGEFLSRTLKDNGVGVSGLRYSKKYNTTLAFVQIDDNGDRSFSFYRNPGADTTLEKGEVDGKLIESSRVFHFGSLSLTDEPVRSATLHALDIAEKSGCVISYDPNLRPLLWKDLEQARSMIVSVLDSVDVLKISKEELGFITGEKDPEQGTLSIYNRHAIPTILVTMGAEGCFYRTGNATGSAPAMDSGRVVDTTGAGDAFIGGFLYFMTAQPAQKPGWHITLYTQQAVLFANAVASVSVTRRGAIPSMPALSEVKNLLAQNGRNI